MPFRIIDDMPAQVGAPVRVERWYDRRLLMWVTRTVDADGNQIGDATYSGTKAGADLDETQRTDAITKGQ